MTRAPEASKANNGKHTFCPFDFNAQMLLESKESYFAELKIAIGCLIRIRVDQSHCRPNGRKMRREEGHAEGLEPKQQLT